MLPYVLYILQNAEPEEKLKIYDYLETFLMRRTIAHLETRGYNSLFSENLLSNKVLTVTELKKYVDKDKDMSYRAAKPKEIKHAVNNTVYINRQALGFLYMIESRLRSETKTATQLLGLESYTLEHLLPKKWKETWEQPADPEVVKETDEALYTFGNLAIIPGALNTSISNAPWQTKLNGKGNKDGLLKHASGHVTLDDCLSKDSWDLSCIRYRAQALFEYIIHIWREDWDEELIKPEELQ